MRRSALLTPAALVATALLAAPAARAAPGDWTAAVRSIPAPQAPPGEPLPVTRTRPSAGAPAEGWAQVGDQTWLYNVTRPSLIALDPDPAFAANPALPAVILVPGGGFEFLSMDNEGYRVAERLKPLGVRVFILKYRTLEFPDGFAGFMDAVRSTFTGAPRKAGPLDITQDVPFATADAQAALRAVRGGAARWRIDPRRVGLVGFSAGAVTTLAVAQANAADARPDFVALIYGPTQAASAPAKAPPLFAAIANDDRFFGKDDLSLIEAWRRSGASTEFHLFSGGGHGFASQPSGATSDGWFEEFARWLKAGGLTGASGKAPAQVR